MAFRLESYGDELRSSYSKSGLKFELRSINHTIMEVHIASNSNFVRLWGPCDLQTTPEVTSDLKIVFIGPNYPELYVHAAYNSYFGGLWGHWELQTTSEVTSDIKIELSGLNNLCSSVFLAFKSFPK